MPMCGRDEEPQALSEPLLYFEPSHDVMCISITAHCYMMCSAMVNFKIYHHPQR
jgi:hypothetical protein